MVVVKNLPANAGDPASIPESGKFPGGGNGNPLAWRISWTVVWQATVPRVAKSQA